MEIKVFVSALPGTQTASVTYDHTLCIVLNVQLVTGAMTVKDDSACFQLAQLRLRQDRPTRSQEYNWYEGWRKSNIESYLLNKPAKYIICPLNAFVNRFQSKSFVFMATCVGIY
jgi:hypothetical protein